MIMMVARLDVGASVLRVGGGGGVKLWWSLFPFFLDCISHP